MVLQPRLVVVLVMLALVAILLSGWLMLGLLVVLSIVAVVDALIARRRLPRAARRIPHLLARGVPAELTTIIEGSEPKGLRMRQPLDADLSVAEQISQGPLMTTITAGRRGRHVVPALAMRVPGPLGLGGWQTRGDVAREVIVYPDLPAARRLRVAVREERLGRRGDRILGALGTGTTFDRVRDYLPDDELRQVNWRATARLGRPMSNQHRIETERELRLCLDVGRLMGSPAYDRTRLDVTLDAATALAMVADELGDRCGALTYDGEVRARVPPGRARAEMVVRRLHAIEPTIVDSDHRLLAAELAHEKRSLVLILTDVYDEPSSDGLAQAVAVLRRRHAVIVAVVRDPGLERVVTTVPASDREAITAAAAVALAAEREQALLRVRKAGAIVVDAPWEQFPVACVQAYLRAKTHYLM